MSGWESRWLGGIAAILLSGAGAAQEAPLTPSGDPAPMPAVRLVEPRPAGLGRERAFFGRVAAHETVALAFEVGGRLVEMEVREGEAVARGAVLARLDPDPLERAVERAALALEQAERDLARAERLAESNVASRVGADDARTGRDLADLALRDARRALADGTIAAPFDGLVAERVAAVFSSVAPGEPILRLHDMSQVRVEIELPEQVLEQAGSLEAIAFSAEGHEGEPVALPVAEFRAEASPVGQSFRVALALPRDLARGLVPGATMTVTARLPVPEGGGALLPPGAILATAERGFEVVVFRPEGELGGTPGRAEVGRVERRAVTLASPTGVGFEVLGLSGDERVVAAGGHRLQDGERVRVHPGLSVGEP